MINHRYVALYNIKKTQLNQDIKTKVNALLLFNKEFLKNSSNKKIFDVNSKIKKVGAAFSNVTYVPSFPRQAFYKTPSGSIIQDPHYNQAEYYHFLAEIENKIIDNYLIRDLMIDLDRVLYYMSNENDINGTSFTRSDAKDVIDEIAKKYESKTGNYNYFIDFIKGYIKGRYPFDFYRVSSDGNLSDDLDDMKKKK